MASMLSATMVVVVAMTACVPVPVPVRPDIEEITTLVPNPDIRVSVGPREFLEKLSRTVEKKNRKVDVVDPILFRDAAFPAGGWYLRDLLGSGQASEAFENMGVRYLAIVRDHGYASSESGGGFNALPMAPVALGAWAWSGRRVLATIVIDLLSRAPVAYLNIDANGRGVGGVFLVYGLFLIPMTNRGAESGIATSIADVVTRGNSGDKVRIAVLAAESDAEYFCLIEEVPNCDIEE